MRTTRGWEGKQKTFPFSRKKRTEYNFWLIVGIAILVFLVIALTISFSIRACARHNVYSESTQSDGTNSQEISPQELSEEAPVICSHYEMSDSIIRICMSKSPEEVSEQMLCKTSYVVSYNKDTKIPNWVAWNLSAEHTDGPYGRIGNFHEDENVPQPRATLEDYRGSGWSRGHMCPAGDNKWDKEAMFDSFSLINVCPQNASLNSGLWNSIEIDCRHWARKYGDIFIVCGPIFMNREHERIGNNQIFVPEAFFKVVLCLNGIPKGIGFIVRNTDGTKKRDLYYNSIDQVERITSIDFFSALPDDIEDEVEASANINDW